MQRACKLVAVVVSTVALFCMLSSAAVAQVISEAPIEDIQSANQYIDDLSTPGLTLQAESEPVAGGAVTAKPGESPWLMDQQQFDPEATSAPIANEVEQITEANQSVIEGNLNTIAPVKETVALTGTESATNKPVMEVPETSSSTPEPSAASYASSTTSEPVDRDSIDSIDSTWRSKLPLGIHERHLFGLGIIVLSFFLSGFIVLWRLTHARVSVLDNIRGKSKQTDHTRAAKQKSSVLRADRTTAVSRHCRRHCVKHTPRRRD